MKFGVVTPTRQLVRKGDESHQVTVVATEFPCEKDARRRAMLSERSIRTLRESGYGDDGVDEIYIAGSRAVGCREVPSVFAKKFMGLRAMHLSWCISCVHPRGPCTFGIG